MPEGDDDVDVPCPGVKVKADAVDEMWRLVSEYADAYYEGRTIADPDVVTRLLAVLRLEVE